MKRLALVAVVVGALAAPAAASAGGMGAWVLSGPPAGIEAGDVWPAKLRVVWCGGLPAAGSASVLVTENASGRVLRFRGHRAGGPGMYTARVVFPSAGRWSYSVEVAGIPGESFGPFGVAAAHQPDRLLASLPPVGAALLVLGTGLILRRRRG